ncbi:MAG: hypothetical protein JNM39_01170 [Bdellovibrionaceae bacterium]|nr:hypothetical protein [Pseudobdellovibrionaceae bacterium]
MTKRFRECFSHEAFLYLIVFLTISALCIYQYAIYYRPTMGYPLGYEGDALFILSIVKTFMDEKSIPFVSATASLLNAPLIAHWGDYPFTEKLIYETMGVVARLTNLYSASTIVLAMGHVLAGLAFAFAARLSSVDKVFSFVGAILFGSASFIFNRGLAHINVGYCWHVPLLVVVTWWMYADAPIQKNSKKFYIALLISLLCGFMNPYYSFLFIQFLCMSILMHLVRKNRAGIFLPLLCISLTLFAFCIADFDYFYNTLMNGANRESVGRSLASLEIYGLRIPELFFPAGYSRIPGFSNFAQRNLYMISFIKGEVWSPYLGLVGISGLFVVFYHSGLNMLKGNFQKVSVESLQIIWILLFSIVGGVNLLFGVLGLQVFRATNRLSIFILAISLIYLFRFLSNHFKGRWATLLSGAIIAVGLFDQLPPRYMPENREAVASLVKEDKAFVKEVESHHPRGANVFMLPVAKFPEFGPILNMMDYDHLRIYCNTKLLHISYGGQKGRNFETWQFELEKKSPKEFVEGIENLGFKVLVINKKGMEKNRLIELQDWLGLNGRLLIAKNNDLFAYNLIPVAVPKPYPQNLIFEGGWSAPEEGFNWADRRKSSLRYINMSPAETIASLKFGIQALVAQDFQVFLNSEPISDKIRIGPETLNLELKNLKLRSGDNRIQFYGSEKPTPAGGGDPRFLTYRLIDPQMMLPGE